MLDALPIPRITNDPSETSEGIQAILTHAAYAPLEDLGWLQVTGEDRVRWLNGMVTNSIQVLTSGQGCYNFFLNAQGRIQADATAFALDHALLLETTRARIPALTAMLDRFIIMDDVELRPMDARAGLLLAGPFAAASLESLGLSAKHLAQLQLVHASFEGAPIDLIHAHSPLVPRFELWATPETIAALVTALAAGLPLATPETIEALRLLEGNPLYGVDLHDRDLPQETAQPGEQSRAIHFSKGCYLGQEIVERIHSRGNVHRTFAGFLLSGPVPDVGSTLFDAAAPDKSIGELTSVRLVQLPTGPATLALGFIRREAIETAKVNPGQIRYSTGSASPIKLPYKISSSA